MLETRAAIRSLKKSPISTTLAILSLALGIGACTIIFNIIASILWQQLPYKTPERLVSLYATVPASCVACHDVFSPREFLDWQEKGFRSFEDAALYKTEAVAIGDSGQQTTVQGANVSASLFAVLGVRPAIGRAFGVDDDRPDAAPAAIISHDFWSKQLAGDSAVVGRTITLDGAAHTIIGVLPGGMRFPGESDVWTPLGERLNAAQDVAGYIAIARLRPGVSLNQAQQEMRILALSAQSASARVQRGATAVPLTDEATQATSGAWILAGAVGSTMIMVLIGFETLLLVRFIGRAHEATIRHALGAGRWQLIRPFLIESFAIAAAGGAVGIALAAAGMVIANQWFGSIGFPPATSLGKPSVLLFAVTLTLVTGAIGGMVPAYGLASSEVIRSIAQRAGGGTLPIPARRMRRTLLVAQVALAFLLTSSSAILVKSFISLQRMDLGYETTHFVVATLDLERTSYATPQLAVSFRQELLDRLRHHPGIVNATAWIIDVPSIGAKPGEPFLTLESDGASMNRYAWPVASNEITNGFFETVGLKILRGRTFDSGDGPGAESAAIINGVAAERWWPGLNPIGRRFKLGSRESTAPWLTVVGVVTNSQEISSGGLSLGTAGAAGRGFFPLVFRPIAQSSAVGGTRCPLPDCGGIVFGVRTFGNPAVGESALRDEIHRLAPNVVLRDDQVGSLKSLQLLWFSDLDVEARIMSAFAVITVILAIIGIVGTIGDTVRREIRDIAIRSALGASARGIMWSYAKQGGLTAGLGLTIGVVGMFAFARPIGRVFFGITDVNRRGQLHGTTATDPTILLGIGVGLLIVATAVSYLASRQVAGCEPMTALRAD